jgi:peptide chain release factor 3
MGLAFNLLDSPGHQDFSEDAHRALTAVDSPSWSLMPPRGPGGKPESSQRSAGCGVPIITFVNKLDRDGRDPFDLLDEIEQSLALDAAPAL